MPKQTPLDPPKDLKIALTVQATYAGPDGERRPLAPHISAAPRPGGLTLQLVWADPEASAAATASGGGTVPTEVECLAQAQQWLDGKIRTWSGRG